MENVAHLRFGSWRHFDLWLEFLFIVLLETAAVFLSFLCRIDYKVLSDTVIIPYIWLLIDGCAFEHEGEVGQWIATNMFLYHSYTAQFISYDRIFGCVSTSKCNCVIH